MGRCNIYGDVVNGAGEAGDVFSHTAVFRQKNWSETYITTPILSISVNLWQFAWRTIRNGTFSPVRIYTSILVLGGQIFQDVQPL